MLVTGVVVTLALVRGAVGGWLLLRDTSEPARSPTEAVDDEPAAFVPRDALVPDGCVGAERAPVVAAAERLPAPFGPVVSGRFYGSEEKVPAAGRARQRGARGAALPARRAGDAAGACRCRGIRRRPEAFSGGAASAVLSDTSFVTAVGGASPTLLTVESASGDLRRVRRRCRRPTAPATPPPDRPGRA